jgi:hypothetical protein
LLSYTSSKFRKSNTPPAARIRVKSKKGCFLNSILRSMLFLFYYAKQYRTINLTLLLLLILAQYTCTLCLACSVSNPTAGRKLLEGPHRKENILIIIAGH